MIDLIHKKTFWTGVASIATGVGFVVADNVPEGSQMILGGLAMIFIRSAITTEAAKCK